MIFCESLVVCVLQKWINKNWLMKKSTINNQQSTNNNIQKPLGENKSSSILWFRVDCDIDSLKTNNNVNTIQCRCKVSKQAIKKCILFLLRLHCLPNQINKKEFPINTPKIATLRSNFWIRHAWAPKTRVKTAGFQSLFYSTLIRVIFAESKVGVKTK